MKGQAGCEPVEGTFGDRVPRGVTHGPKRTEEHMGVVSASWAPTWLGCALSVDRPCHRLDEHGYVELSHRTIQIYHAILRTGRYL